MANFLLLAVVGLIAQLVDGSLGMAYGVTSQSLLLTIGIAPALASASVHIAEVGTTAASGVSHWRFKNVDWAKVWPLAIPGAIGAFFGAVVLSSFITAEAAEPIVAIFLFGLGVFVLARFSFRRHERPVQVRPVSRGFLAPLGLIAGFLDAAGGGGWGPISTPTLLSSGRMEPRKIIGTVDTSEFVIAVCASVGFLISLSLAEVPWTIVAALFLGGLIAAPVAAYIVRILPTRIMGTAVGGFILVVNANTFFGAVGLSSSLSTVAFILIIGVWIAALAFAIGAKRQDQEEAVEGQAV
jgi:uncharacterized membrane protein YfcA